MDPKHSVIKGLQYKKAISSIQQYTVQSKSNRFLHTYLEKVLSWILPSYKQELCPLYLWFQNHLVLIYHWNINWAVLKSN